MFNSTTIVFSGVVNSLISPNSVKSLMTLYRVDCASLPLANFRTWSIVRGLDCFSNKSRTTNLGLVIEAFLELRRVRDVFLTETIRKLYWRLGKLTKLHFRPILLISENENHS